MLKCQNTAETAKSLPVDDDESLHSYDLSALFTNVPEDQILRVIKDRLDFHMLLKNFLNIRYYCEVTFWMFELYVFLFQMTILSVDLWEGYMINSEPFDL